MRDAKSNSASEVVKRRREHDAIPKIPQRRSWFCGFAGLTLSVRGMGSTCRNVGLVKAEYAFCPIGKVSLKAQGDTAES